MAAIFSDAQTVAAVVATEAAQVSIAAVNGPQSVVISAMATRWPRARHV